MNHINNAYNFFLHISGNNLEKCHLIINKIKKFLKFPIDPKEKNILVFYGTGNNGKTTLINILQHIPEIKFLHINNFDQIDLVDQNTIFIVQDSNNENLKKIILNNTNHKILIETNENLQDNFDHHLIDKIEIIKFDHNFDEYSIPKREYNISEKIIKDDFSDFLLLIFFL